MYYIFYNGYDFEKRFSKEFLNYIYRSNNNNCSSSSSSNFCSKKDDLRTCIDWNKSTRKQLCVTSEKVYNKLLKCTGHYYWPDGKKFRCYPYKQQRQHQQQQHQKYNNNRSSLFHYRNNNNNNNNNDGCNGRRGRHQRRRQSPPIRSTVVIATAASKTPSPRPKVAFSPTPSSPLLWHDNDVDDQELDLYAQTHGYEDNDNILEEGEIVDYHTTFSCEKR
jgi:hypothetical protein